LANFDPLQIHQKAGEVTMSRTASLCVAVLIFSFDLILGFLFGSEAVWVFIFLLAVARPYLTRRHFAFIILFLLFNCIRDLGDIESWRECTEYILARIPEIPNPNFTANIVLVIAVIFATCTFLGYYYFCRHLIKKLRIHERIGYALSN